MRQKFLTFVCVLSLIITTVSLCACNGSKKSAPSDGFIVYFYSNDGLGLQPVSYKLKGTNKTAQTEEVLELLSKKTVDVDYINPISEDLTVENYQFSDETLIIYFNKAYNSLSEMNQAMLKASVVRTLVQLDGVSYVEFYIGDEPLKDDEGYAVGPMNEDSFLVDYGMAQSQAETAKVMLYYATEDGTKLREVSRIVHYSSNIPLEQVVLNYLADNPKEDGIKSPIPEGSKVLSVVINEGTCYVTLDSGFLVLPEWESREVEIYAIVNTLCELDTIDKVQLIVSAEKDVAPVGKDEVSGTYTPEYEIVE